MDSFHPLYGITLITATVCSSLTTQSGSSRLVESLLTQLRDTRLGRFPAYTATGCLDRDSLAELVQSLSSLAESYHSSRLEVGEEEDTDSDDVDT